MDPCVKDILRKIIRPYRIAERKIAIHYWINHEMKLVEKFFLQKYGKHIDWDNPQDLNEKINWLKFHIDQHEWARLADKYAVREYVKERGLEKILIPLYGRWDNVYEFMNDFDKLPEEFVLKSNTGAVHVLIFSKENGEKNAVDKRILKGTVRQWLNEKDYGLLSSELHYQFINNCIIAEQLLKPDEDQLKYSQTLIDYKIWCFNGNPYGCLVVLDRQNGNKIHHFAYFDLQWNNRTDLLIDGTINVSIPKPKNWDVMLEYAKILSKGHPQVRVDFYNIDGDIYFGEMTMTSACGFNGRYSKELLEDMGKNIILDMNMPWNEFAELKKSDV